MTSDTYFSFFAKQVNYRPVLVLSILRQYHWLPAFSLFPTVFLTLSSIYTHFNTLMKNALGKHRGKR